jgi:hypothetical protein
MGMAKSFSSIEPPRRDSISWRAAAKDTKMKMSEIVSVLLA